MNRRAVLFLPVLLTAVVSTAGCSSSTDQYQGVVESTVLDDKTKLAMIADQLASEAESFGIADPPEVDIVRIVPLNEWLETTMTCMSESGFPVKKTADGEGVDYSDVPPELGSQLDLAQYVCDAKYPVDPSYVAPLNESQLKFLYWYFTGPLTKCLEENGYQPPAPPSYTIFAQNYADPGKTWSPYQDLINNSTSPADTNRYFEACPQLPDQNELYPAAE